MRMPQFDAHSLLSLFRRRRVVTMDEMKAALGTAVDRTVFRKLSEWPYLSSYSHRGKFYTLETLAQFDERDLWTWRGIHFSRFGSLVDTAEQFVTRSDRGFLASELAAELLDADQGTSIPTRHLAAGGQGKDLWAVRLLRSRDIEAKGTTVAATRIR